MNKTLPDKWIRKAISEAINGIVVDGKTIYCYDTMVTTDINSDPPQHYILMTSQSSEVDKNNKCEWFWDSQIVIDIVTRYRTPGNTGSRLLADNILDEVLSQIDGLTLDGGLEIVTQNVSIPSDIFLDTKKELIYRKILRLELKIK